MYNIKKTYDNSEYSWKFTRARPGAPGSGDVYPPSFNVNMPAFLEGEFKAGGLMPFIILGLEHHTPAMVLNFNYRYEFAGSISKSKLYDTHVGNHVIAISVAFWKKKERLICSTFDE